MKVQEIITEWSGSGAVPASEIQGVLNLAMLDAGDLVVVSWKPFVTTDGHHALYKNPTVDYLVKGLVDRFLGSSAEDVMVASTVWSSDTSVLGILKFIQQHAQNKKGIDPRTIQVNTKGYSIDKLSMFWWNGIVFLVIKDITGNRMYGGPRDTHYTIYAAPDKNYKAPAVNGEEVPASS